MTALGYIALFGWLVAGPALVAMLGPRRGILATIGLGWLFLPMASIPLDGLPDFSKMLVVSVSALLGAALFDASCLSRFRPGMIDLPMLVWCAVPMASSLTNGLGIWDGVSATLDQAITWGVPWLLARVYFRDSAALRDLALAIVLLALVYLPFVAWELRMSPNLHYMVYGFHQHEFIQTRRFGGWRPMVFMQHGLALSMFLAGAAIISTWVWLTGAQRRILGVPMGLIALVLIAFTILCKSVGAIALMALILVVLLISRTLRLRVALIALLLCAPLYMGLRATRIWDGSHLLTVAGQVVPSKVSSLRTRIEAENQLTQKALDMPIFGWGGWGRWRVRNERGFDTARSDGLWVIALGQNGLVGLASLTLSMSLPVLLFLLRVPRENLFRAVCAPALALACVVIAFQIDSLLNAMLNPMWVLAMGGLAAVVTHVRVRAPAPTIAGRAALEH